MLVRIAVEGPFRFDSSLKQKNESLSNLTFLRPPIQLLTGHSQTTATRVFEPRFYFQVGRCFCLLNLIIFATPSSGEIYLALYRNSIL